MDEGPGVQLPSSAALLNVHLLKKPLTTRGDLVDDDDRDDDNDHWIMVMEVIKRLKNR